ncbi:four-carbon acid sugar kinase family protein [Inquilinus sp. NPDC058860]|uniref:four-carbon acid sugar kinase family protein n=1 Tax=Inquilinus sp. NPDC058860 TaxID=3346652 RepID=UPI0036876933
MTRLQLIADDLTGALDTAAPFAGAAGPIPVYWTDAPHVSPAAGIALDSGTREAGRDEARTILARLVAGLPKAPGAIFYAKLDSLLRGHAGAEVAAWLQALAPAHCIIAPAFPAQGRVTRHGVQLARKADGWWPVAADLGAELRREGLAVQRRRPGDPVPPGVSLWDAETDADLAAIAAAGRALEAPVLWCGSGGLAGALAGPLRRPVAPPVEPAGPVLGLFGTDHPATAAQLAACAPLVTVLPPGGNGAAARLGRQLSDQGVALAAVALPEGLARDEAARRIAEELGALVRRIDPPGTLLVAGGETLRTLCMALEAERLDLDGHLQPGVPHSTLRGGRFDGVRVISKSGAFGDPGLLRRLLGLERADLQGAHA